MKKEKQKLSQQLFQLFATHSGQWFVKGDLLRMQWLNPDGVPYMSTTVARTLNIMESEKHLIQARPFGRNTVEYRFLSQNMRAEYIPWSERANEKKDVLFRNQSPQMQLL